VTVIERIMVRSISDDPQKTLKECEQCVGIQEEVGWGGEAVSSHILRADSIGLVTDIVDLGYVLVAEQASSGEIVGFARVTYTSDPKKHWLHEVAVLPHFQGYGVGYKIMMEVRSRSRAGGASHLFFTYDFMDVRNGNLYLTKCGGRGVRVFYNLYGLKAEGSSRNRLSHRLLVRWDLLAQAVPLQSKTVREADSVKFLDEVRQGRSFALELPAVGSGDTEGRLLEWQEATFPVLYESINSMGYEAAYVARSTGNETAYLVLVPRSNEDASHSWQTHKEMHMDELKELLDRLREKLQYTRRLIQEYDHAMDFASHCTMQGLAEGIEFAVEEIEEFLEGKGQGSRGKGQGTTKGKGTGTGKGRDKNKGKVKAKAVKRTKVKREVKGKKQTKEKSKVKAEIGVKGKRRR